MGWRFPHALRATWELHASVHEPTRGTSLFQICVTAFAYISILSCFFCSLFSLFLQISRSAVLRWPSGGHVTTDTQTRSQPLLVNGPWWSTVAGYRATHRAVGTAPMKTVLLTTLRQLVSDSYALSVRRPASPRVPRPVWLTIFFLLLSDKHLELYIGKYCIRLQYSCS